MESLWARCRGRSCSAGVQARPATSAARQVEPKPARPRPGKHRGPGSSSIPTTYEIGLPNQGLQILYRDLGTSAPARWAERSYAPWVDMEAEGCRCTAVPLFSLENHLPRPASFDVIAFQIPLGRARLHERPQPARPGSRACRCGPRTAPGPSTPRGGRRALRLQPQSPWPTSWTPSSSATARGGGGRDDRGAFARLARRCPRPCCPKGTERQDAGPAGQRLGPGGLRPEPLRAELRRAAG